jgi:SAM-dependent methyltransferase
MTRRRKGKAARVDVVKPSDPTSEITAAVARTLSSLEELTRKCRSHGIDPMTTMMSVISRLRASEPVPATQTDTASAWMATHTNIVQRSRALVDALDRGDLEAVEPALAPGFIHVVGRTVTDRETSLSRINQRTSKGPYFGTRTWESETVTPNGDAVVFNGKAREVQGNNETHGGYINDGWYSLQWLCIGTEWRVRFLSWQKDTTDRDWWNDTFTTGRGFNHAPNQLLVEIVENVSPGTALDLAMGQGRNALFLASRGWNVVGVDVSDEGQRIAREQAVKRGLALETVTANIDEWEFGIDRFDLVTLLYAGDDARWIDKIKASMRLDGLVVVEGWAKTSPDSPIGFAEGQLKTLFDGYEILRDEIVDDVPDWARDKGTLARFVARKRR